ncbi:MAG: hypothetical protein OEU36_06565 [Gammaproteobacteria bacterium]|nr:hypothetical protein [Gammaproteobacteria bacterium]
MKLLTRDGDLRIGRNVLDLKFEIVEEVSGLSQILEDSRVDREAVVMSAERIMALETKMKLMHLEFLIEVKNGLSEEQIFKFKKLRRRLCCR